MARPKMLKLSEVLKEIDMSRAAFYRMRARGQAPRLQKLPNGHLRVSRADLDAWWERCGQRAVA
ncbi:helix-turn-helix domain-containing protein [Streptomyces sp. NPDC048332]|uniref:helix-turn-helix transcriptional regulator n=1 Tax=Streptomyces sp. NPDC048332 TaxID=3154619 RepID=UPI00325381DD